MVVIGMKFFTMMPNGPGLPSVAGRAIDR